MKATATAYRDVSPSALLSEVRADCIAKVQIAGFTPAMQVTVKRCMGYTPATKRLSCMLPTYESSYTAAANFYNAEAGIHRIATSRGFASACTNLLSDSPAVIAEEKRMLDTVGSLVAAMKAGKVLAFEQYSGEVINAAAEVQQGQNANSASLSICRDQ